MYYIVLIAFTMLIPLFFLIAGIKTLKQKNEKYECITTAVIENIEIEQRVQEPKIKTLFISYKYVVDGVEYHSRENLLNKNNADVRPYEKSEELGKKLGLPINSEIEVMYQASNHSKSTYDMEWKKQRESVGSAMNLILGGGFTFVLLIIEALLIWSYIVVERG